MLRWIDTEAAVIVLCDQCHRGPHGVHHLAAVAAAVHPFMIDGYLLTVGASPQWEESADAQMVEAAGLQPEPGEPS